MLVKVESSYKPVKICQVDISSKKKIKQNKETVSGVVLY